MLKNVILYGELVKMQMEFVKKSGNIEAWIQKGHTKAIDSAYFALDDNTCIAVCNYPHIDLYIEKFQTKLSEGNFKTLHEYYENTIKEFMKDKKTNVSIALADYLGLLQEGIAHNIKVREYYDQKRRLEIENSENEQKAEQERANANFANIIENAEHNLLERNEVINEAIKHYNRDGVCFDTTVFQFLMNKYSIDVPTRTKGWIVNSLYCVYFDNEDKKAYCRTKTNSSIDSSKTFMLCVQRLIKAIKEANGINIDENEIRQAAEHEQLKNIEDLHFIPCRAFNERVAHNMLLRQNYCFTPTESERTAVLERIYKHLDYEDISDKIANYFRLPTEIGELREKVVEKKRTIVAKYRLINGKKTVFYEKSYKDDKDDFYVAKTNGNLIPCISKKRRGEGNMDNRTLKAIKDKKYDIFEVKHGESKFMGTAKGSELYDYLEEEFGEDVAEEFEFEELLQLLKEGEAYVYYMRSDWTIEVVLGNSRFIDDETLSMLSGETFTVISTTDTGVKSVTCDGEELYNTMVELCGEEAAQRVDYDTIANINDVNVAYSFLVRRNWTIKVALYFDDSSEVAEESATEATDTSEEDLDFERLYNASLLKCKRFNLIWNMNETENFSCAPSKNLFLDNIIRTTAAELNITFDTDTLQDIAHYVFEELSKKEYVCVWFDIPRIVGRSDKSEEYSFLVKRQGADSLKYAVDNIEAASLLKDPYYVLEAKKFVTSIDETIIRNKDFLDVPFVEYKSIGNDGDYETLVVRANNLKRNAISISTVNYLDPEVEAERAAELAALEEGKKTVISESIRGTFSDIKGMLGNRRKPKEPVSKEAVTEFKRKSHTRTGQDGKKYKVKGTTVHKNIKKAN